MQVAYEGLLTLAKLGVPMENALDAINAASGRSLVSSVTPTPPPLLLLLLVLLFLLLPSFL